MGGVRRFLPPGAGALFRALRAERPRDGAEDVYKRQGEDVDVSLLVPAGRETHSFEPTPLDVIRVSEADVFVYNGGESEVWVENILGAAGEKIPHVLRMMDYADALEEEFTEGMQQSGHDHDHDEDDSDEISYDEHIWTSPVQAQTLCRAIADTLLSLIHISAMASAIF